VEIARIEATMPGQTRSHLEEWAALLEEELPEDVETNCTGRRSSVDVDPRERRGG
jgi:hypothetical protein